MNAEERHKMLQDSVKENAALREDVSRYRGMIEYARAAPDFSSCKSILADALDGVNGAENYEEVKGVREALRARIAVLEKVAEEVADQCPYCQGQGFTVTTGTGMEHDPNDPDGEPIAVPIPIQEQCQFCYYARAALDAAKEG